MYRQVIDNLSSNINSTVIQRISDGAFIPCAEDNKDYKDYLIWAETHTINPPLE